MLLTLLVVMCCIQIAGVFYCFMSFLYHCIGCILLWSMETKNHSNIFFWFLLLIWCLYLIKYFKFVCFWMWILVLNKFKLKSNSFHFVGVWLVLFAIEWIKWCGYFCDQYLFVNLSRHNQVCAEICSLSNLLHNGTSYICDGILHVVMVLISCTLTKA